MKQLGIQLLDYELDTIIRCEKYFKDTVFYDIGCHLGLWSVAAFLNGAKFVIGFDIMPPERTILNLHHFGPRYRILNCIVTNDEGMKVSGFRITLDNFYNTVNCVSHEENDYGLAHAKIANKNDFRPGFIKIDVEGTELHVLEGGLEMITSCLPHLMIESHDYMKRCKKQDIFDFIDRLGYNQPEFVTSIEGGNMYHIFYKSPGIITI